MDLSHNGFSEQFADFECIWNKGEKQNKNKQTKRGIFFSYNNKHN